MRVVVCWYNCAKSLTPGSVSLLSGNLDGTLVVKTKEEYTLFDSWTTNPTKYVWRRLSAIR